ncbi:MAG: hypothetical protein HYR64_05735 [Fimbriimonas ginsengisoli]|uniref:Uncharacterized protein n=1 Tax=Fimbriimonas ginsengisoli TaxID=1005039 RepID=A0A931LVG2_FIMGI|nr:hypothetical protein [Fimbriimonas ginsengisoli]
MTPRDKVILRRSLIAFVALAYLVVRVFFLMALGLRSDLVLQRDVAWARFAKLVPDHDLQSLANRLAGLSERRATVAKPLHTPRWMVVAPVSEAECSAEIWSDAVAPKIARAYWLPAFRTRGDASYCVEFSGTPVTSERVGEKLVHLGNHSFPLVPRSDDPDSFIGPLTRRSAQARNPYLLSPHNREVLEIYTRAPDGGLPGRWAHFSEHPLYESHWFYDGRWLSSYGLWEPGTARDRVKLTLWDHGYSRTLSFGPPTLRLFSLDKPRPRRANPGTPTP